MGDECELNAEHNNEILGSTGPEPRIWAGIVQGT